MGVECEIWTGRLTDKGYGRVWHEGRNRPAHAVAYEAVHGPIPEGLEIDHLCGVRACVNVAHLEAVTHLENVRRAHPPKTHCKRGHALTPDVLYISPKGKKTCRDCKALARSGAVRRLSGDRGGVEWGGGPLLEWGDEEQVTRFLVLLLVSFVVIASAFLVETWSTGERIDDGQCQEDEACWDCDTHGDGRCGVPLRQVPECTLDALSIVAQHPQPEVAVGTEQAPDLPGDVIVVDMQGATLCLRSTTDGAAPALER